MVDIIFVTGNNKKVAEAKAILGEVVSQDIEIDEIQSMDAKLVAIDKVEKAYSKLQKPCFVEDVSFWIDELGGFPGPYVKDMMEKVGPERIGKMFEGSKAQVQCTIAYHDGSEPRCFVGLINGKIVLEVGQGWMIDRIFMPEGETQRWAEMSEEKKNMISHRKLALDKFSKFILEE